MDMFTYVRDDIDVCILLFIQIAASQSSSQSPLILTLSREKLYKSLVLISVITIRTVVVQDEENCCFYDFRN